MLCVHVMLLSDVLMQAERHLIKLRSIHATRDIGLSVTRLAHMKPLMLIDQKQAISK